MNVSLLASGSKGNSLLISSKDGNLLIDAGLSARETVRRLASLGVAPEELTAILVTHEHVDHVRGLELLSRRYRLPVYLHHATAGALAGNQRPATLVEFETGMEFVVAGLAVKSFPVTHDAEAPVGFTVTSSYGTLGLATDLGIATRLVAEELNRCRYLVLESNHDETLLRDGPYPWPLKQRIRSKHGHLSNWESAELLGKLCWDGLEAVFLAHLSETNNHPDLAATAAREVLGRQCCCQPELLIGCQDRPISWPI
jgi:phosphoribosyl 1,2-cyclic phosphodiesterase